ncbi:ADP-ribosyl cyclase/cyclic ADP-ribose hydrolase [Citrus sinensis]|uniref:ADP-ribosyl cyclase/cyclic ADP-ribose hydrolase n=1 Tax=Citrus sinensis TaxID=2711 RepID=A0ACB8MAW2_CITSI|nr:ADP-ribosyl cyclase/cyclic ADP-ribose hydrolase [Citrus sinensis]
MASSSSCGNYEVFLNFRGEDTRKSFTCYLYDKLYEGKKIKTFIDDEGLRRGDEISPALLYAIQGSKISVVIFSKDYASSKWCLNELVKILECKNTNGQIIIPVFYGVSPSDVRHQNGTFGDRFDELKKQFKDKPEMVQKWRDALTETSHLAGHESTKFRLDAQLVNKIVEDVLKKLEKITVSTDSSNGLVGLNSRIEQIKPFLCMDLWDTVQIVGIWGTGGIGKTTLAEAIFDQFSGEFDGKYFAKNVRRKSETEGGLEDLQKEMLSTILSEKLEVAGPNIPQFTKGRVRRMKVLIVLDDVNKDEQLEGLIGGLDQYGPGSRIVVTTRDKRVLEKFGVEKIYRVNGLRLDEAFEHFCNFAFKENHCPEDLNRHSRRFVKYAKGNPLVLKVLGSSLYLKRKSHWENVLDDLNRICESDIHNIYEILKISFYELTPRVQSIFLDIACFFEGGDKDFLARILDDSESDGLDVLIDKSLISISGDSLQMHDILQEMGRQIVRQESEKEPGKRSRLWDPKEIRRVLKHNKGTDAIEGIFLDLSKIKRINLDPGAFTNMSNMRLLKFYGIEKLPSMSIEEHLSYSKVQLPNGLDYLPKKLRYLHWDTYPLRTLPSNFKPKNLVALNLSCSKVEQLWEGEKEAFKLKSINLSHSQHFIKMPGPFETPNVETYLLDYTNLACVPSSIQNFKYLSALSFEGCKSLRSFPSNLHFVCPVTINFSYCVNLIEFPLISGKVTSLNLSKSAIEEVPSSIECLTDLKKLNLKYCKRLKRISTRFCKLRSLVDLFLNGCVNLERFPEILEKMEHLERINLNKTAITELPSSFENLPGLEELFVEDCSKLDKLPDNIGNLKCLFIISAVGSAISQLPSSSVAYSNRLGVLYFSRCKGLVSLPRSFLLGLAYLGHLDMRNCAVMEIPQEIACLSSLTTLNLSGNSFESLPASIKQLSQLRSLHLEGCKMLQSLPELPLCLESLDLTGCNMLRSLPELPLCLHSLNATNCNRLQSLPEIPSCLQELDASVLEKLSKPSPDLCEWHPEYRLSQPIYFRFTNCLKLDGKANNKILADSLRMAIAASLRRGKTIDEKLSELRRSQIVLPGSKIPDWFSNQSSGSSIRIQLPPHSFCRNLIGFAFCAVLDFKQLYSDRFRNVYVGCRSDLEIKTLSETKHVHLSFDSHSIEDLIDSDHVILGFKPCLNVGFPDGYHHTTVSLKFFNECCRNLKVQKGQKIKRCGVCPVYANPSEIKANTFTLNFATEVWKLDDLPSASGTAASEFDSSSDEGELYYSFDEEELEPSPKRICRADQINTS